MAGVAARHAELLGQSDSLTPGRPVPLAEFSSVGDFSVAINTDD